MKTLKIVLVNIAVVYLVMAFSAPANADGLLVIDALKTGIDLFSGVKHTAEKFAEKKREEAKKIETIEKRFEANTGIKLKIGNLLETIHFANETKVLVYEAKVNGDDGAFLLAAKQGRVAGDICYEATDMPVFKKILEMNELQKKKHVHADFLKYAKVDLGSLESPPSLKTSAVSPDDQR